MHNTILTIADGRITPALEVCPAAVTIDDVLELLRELRLAYFWRRDTLGLIRAWDWHAGEWSFTPLTALVRELTGHTSDCWLGWDTYLPQADIPLALAGELVAAEDANGLHDPSLRARLLAALGLQESA
jgi:hypothetical protein